MYLGMQMSVHSKFSHNLESYKKLKRSSHCRNCTHSQLRMKSRKLQMQMVEMGRRALDIFSLLALPLSMNESWKLCVLSIELEIRTASHYTLSQSVIGVPYRTMLLVYLLYLLYLATSVALLNISALPCFFSRGYLSQ